MTFYEKKYGYLEKKTYDTVPTSMALRFTKKKKHIKLHVPKTMKILFMIKKNMLKFQSIQVFEPVQRYRTLIYCGKFMALRKINYGTTETLMVLGKKPWYNPEIYITKLKTMEL